MERGFRSMALLLGLELTTLWSWVSINQIHTLPLKWPTCNRNTAPYGVVIALKRGLKSDEMGLILTQKHFRLRAVSITSRAELNLQAFHDTYLSTSYQESSISRCSECFVARTLTRWDRQLILALKGIRLPGKDRIITETCNDSVAKW